MKFSQKYKHRTDRFENCSLESELKQQQKMNVKYNVTSQLFVIITSVQCISLTNTNEMYGHLLV